MKYICSVYSIHHKTNSYHDKLIRKRRAHYAMDRAAEFFNKGEKVFSPIAHCHTMSSRNKMPKDYAFWQSMDRHMIDLSDGVKVLMMPHWEDSEGITDEILYAASIGKPIEYIDCSDYHELFEGDLIYGSKTV